MNRHDPFLREALELAERGRGHVHPNPLVGAVVTRDGVVVGKGFHARFGGTHAEIEAIADAGGESACRGATLYVTLEPCSHHGKTPPCVDAIIRAGFARVVYSVRDPNPEVNGAGRRALESAGIEVIEGVLEEQAREANRAYLRWREFGLPFVTWKVAQTLDGRMTLESGKRTAITGESCWSLVREMRARVDAVVIGIETAIIDDPRLRTRSEGVSAVDPRRIVFDSRARLPSGSRLVRENSDRKTVVVSACAVRRRDLAEAGIELVVVPAFEGRIDLFAAFTELARRGYLDILLESGRTLGEACIRCGLVQRVIVLQAPLIGPARGVIASTGSMGDDILVDLKLP